LNVFDTKRALYEQKDYLLWELQKILKDLDINVFGCINLPSFIVTTEQAQDLYDAIA